MKSINVRTSVLVGCAGATRRPTRWTSAKTPSTSVADACVNPGVRGLHPGMRARWPRRPSVAFEANDAVEGELGTPTDATEHQGAGLSRRRARAPTQRPDDAELPHGRGSRLPSPPTPTDGACADTVRRPAVLGRGQEPYGPRQAVARVPRVVEGATDRRQDDAA